MHVLRAAHERGRDKVHVLADAEQQVAAVGFADIGHVYIGIGQVDALAVGEPAAVERLTDDVRTAHGGHGKGDLSVVHKYARAGRDVFGKARERDLHPRRIARAGRRAEGELLPLLQHGLPALKLAEPDLRPLGVEHDGGVQPVLFAQALDAVHARLMVGMRTVREVEAGAVHARQHELFQYSLAVRSGAQRADNLCFSHMTLPSSAAARRGHAERAAAGAVRAGFIATKL